MIPALYQHLWVIAAILFLTQGGQAMSAICIVLVPAESVPRRLVGSAIGFNTMFGEPFGGFLARRSNDSYHEVRPNDLYRPGAICALSVSKPRTRRVAARREPAVNGKTPRHNHTRAR